jgi:arylsulfatase A-like enzyme
MPVAGGTVAKPNVVFVTIDSARADHFRLYGYSKRTTPFIDSLSRDAAVYSNANAPAAWTRPAMTSIFTSLYPQQYDFFGDKYPGESVPILSEILKQQGYRVIALSNNPYMSPSTGFDRGVEQFYFIYQGQFPGVLDKRVIVANVPGMVKQYLNRRTAFKIVSKMINDQARVLLRRVGSDGRPFFMYIHHDAHHPYLSDRRFLRPFLDPGVKEEEIRLVEEVQASGNMYWFSSESHKPAERERHYRILRSMHDASIYKNDILIGELVKELKSSGLYDRTMLVITADHGEFLGERDLVSHGFYPYEESVRVPLIIKFPRDSGVAGTIDGTVSTIDLAPTVLELAGTDIHSHLPAAQGKSLLGKERHEFVITERMNFAKGLDFWNSKYPDHRFEEFDYGCLISFKTASTKFVWSSKGRHALFDLRSDPAETRNLYDPEGGDSSAAVKKARDWMEGVPRVPTAGTAEFDEKIKEHLRGLGYIE